jgi:PPK2 family polyphosphate:nucleotide phosphotransferase
MNQDAFIFTPGSKVSLRKDYDPAYQDGYYEKADAAQKLQENIQQLAKYQDTLYAQNAYALLIIFQAMDAAGKDSTIKHVMSGVNPQGFQVFSFKAPSDEELDHDYLWRATKALPERGRIGIFNRSYYEETLVVRVHPELLKKQNLPQDYKGNQIWKQRFEEINNFEKYLVNNGIVVLKFFLNVSKDEQKKRFLERLKYPDKNWKFSVNDVRERAFWDNYMQAYEEVFQYTSTDYAPWYIVPADRKWYTRLVVSDIICSRLQQLNLKYPTVSEEHHQELLKAKSILEQED